MSEAETKKEVIEEDLTAEEAKAAALCDQVNAVLEAAEENDTLSDELMEKSLQQFKEALDMDEDCLEARIGIVYVCGLLGLYDEGIEELKVIEDMDIKDDRIPEMKERLQLMKKEEEEAEGEEDGEEEGEEDEKKDEKTDDSKEEAGPTVANLIVDGVVQPKFVAALTEVFHRFDKNSDGALDEKELNAFVMTTNGSPMDSATLRFLRTHFEVDKNRSLTLNGFVHFYISQTMGSAEETWKDLTALGYNSELSLVKK